uniref:Predicted protein n=1 Tax=Hordeum vulgare subsp. vulgare TaxID=112509 RepID=F2D058_HORVV|nr:predicted protein [Hordeum vulgare subsp. vulgare]
MVLLRQVVPSGWNHGGAVDLLLLLLTSSAGQHVSCLDLGSPAADDQTAGCIHGRLISIYIPLLPSYVPCRGAKERGRQRR